jgi:hypothetical protein
MTTKPPNASIFKKVEAAYFVRSRKQDNILDLTFSPTSGTTDSVCSKRTNEVFHIASYETAVCSINADKINTVDSLSRKNQIQSCTVPL